MNKAYVSFIVRDRNLDAHNYTATVTGIAEVRKWMVQQLKEGNHVQITKKQFLEGTPNFARRVLSLKRDYSGPRGISLIENA